MTPSVRILTLVYADPPAERLAPDHPWHQFDALGRTLRRHRPGATAAVFARPEIAVDGSGTVTWTSALAGQPRSLTEPPCAHLPALDAELALHVARVTSTNPGCRSCALRKIGRSTWRGDLFYGCRGRGIVQVSYAAYDSSGRMICSGNGSDLCLGRRR